MVGILGMCFLVKDELRSVVIIRLLGGILVLSVCEMSLVLGRVKVGVMWKWIWVR